MSVQSFPLDWPSGWPRTLPADQERGYQFKTRREHGPSALVTFSRARDLLYSELDRLGVSSVVISSNHKPDSRGIPIEAKRSVGDEGVAVYFQYKGKPMVMACDRFDNAAANMRSLGMAIDAMRQLERHGGGHMMTRAFSGFEALPAPGAPPHWASVLHVPRNASKEQAKAAYRKLAKEYHPDAASGSTGRMADLNRAFREALAEIE